MYRDRSSKRATLRNLMAACSWQLGWLGFWQVWPGFLSLVSLTLHYLRAALAESTPLTHPALDTWTEWQGLGFSSGTPC